jgi:hypothetical protein
MARGAKDVTWMNPRPSQESNPPFNCAPRAREESDPILIVNNDSIAKRISESPLEDDFFRKHAYNPTQKSTQNYPEVKKTEPKIAPNSNKKPELRPPQTTFDPPKLPESNLGIGQTVNNKLDNIKSSLHSYLNDNDVRKSQQESVEVSSSQSHLKREETRAPELMGSLPNQFESTKLAPAVIQQSKPEKKLEQKELKPTGFFSNSAKPTQQSVVKEEENDDFDSDFESKRPNAKPKSSVKKSKKEVSFGSDEFEDLF